MSKIINLSSPTLEVVDFVNSSDIEEIVSLIQLKNGEVHFLSSSKDIGFLTFLKIELESAISAIIYDNYNTPDE